AAKGGPRAGQQQRAGDVVLEHRREVGRPRADAPADGFEGGEQHADGDGGRDFEPHYSGGVVGGVLSSQRGRPRRAAAWASREATARLTTVTPARPQNRVAPAAPSAPRVIIPATKRTTNSPTRSRR